MLLPMPMPFRRIAFRTAAPLQRLLRRLAKALRRADSRLCWMNSVAQFRAEEDDLFVVSYPKSGTTWMQMILFQLTTDGDLDRIRHLMDYSPHLEEVDAVAPAAGARRIIKTHLPRDYWLDCSRGRYVYVVREAKDVAVSYYHHYRNYYGFSGDLDSFVERFLAGTVDWGSWFDHVGSWRREAANPRVLFVRYEDLVGRLEESVRRIAAFCGIGLDDARLARVLERSSFVYMQAHREKIDLVDHVEKRSPLVSGLFLRHGMVGDGQQISAAQCARIEAHASACGLEAYVRR